jgi:signal peptide peptidase SppA
MKFILADLDLYADYMAKSPNIHNPDMEAFENARSSRVELYQAGSDAIIPVTGPLSYKYDFFTWLMDGSSYQMITAQINAAEKEDSVERIVLSMDTPGGDVVGMPEMAEAIRNASKPVIAVVDPMCASAGLWMAAQADRIVIMESGSIGSLGVQIVAVSQAEMYAKAGIDVKLIRADISPNKNLATSLEPLDEKAVNYLQERVDMWGAEFLKSVAQGRGVTTDQALDKFGQGHMLFGAEAVEAGLADEIGSLQGVVLEQTPKQNSYTASYSAKHIIR